MRKLLILQILMAMVLAACSKVDENAHKTTDWYLEHRDELAQDLEKCKQISLKNQENWCAAAQQADRTLTAKKIKDGAMKSYY